MIHEPKKMIAGLEPDEVMREIWRVKDEISAEYNGDIHRFFEDMRKSQKASGREVVSFEAEDKVA